MANLSSAQLRFLTPAHTNDKDWDTAISANVWCFDGTICASAFDFANNPDKSDYFPDDGTESPKTYPLNVTVAVNQNNLIHGVLDIIINPVGNDTWVFIPILILGFTDGSEIIHQAFNPRVVDQDGPTTTFVF